MALSLEAGISTRHLSFLETGRASPSREMILTLAETLDVPLREQNSMLAAAGFAPIYGITPLDAPAMGEVRSALEHLLEGHEPNPALVVNRRYDVLMTNHAARVVLGTFAPGGGTNVVRMLLAADGLRTSMANSANERARTTLSRLLAESKDAGRQSRG